MTQKNVSKSADQLLCLSGLRTKYMNAHPHDKYIAHAQTKVTFTAHEKRKKVYSPLFAKEAVRE